jgi:hypothetical protein
LRNLRKGGIMKGLHLFFVIMAMAVLMVASPAQADNKAMGGALVKLAAEDINAVTGHNNVTVAPAAGGFNITFLNPRLTPRGDTKGQGLTQANRVRIGSGIADAKSQTQSPYFDEQAVSGGRVTFFVPNYALKANTPVVEHLWGIGQDATSKEPKHLVLDPNDPWVMDGPNRDNQQLAVVVVMYPDGRVVPGKTVYSTKPKQGMAAGAPEQ